MNYKVIAISTAAVLIIALMSACSIEMQPRNPRPWADNILMEDWDNGRAAQDYPDYSVFGSEITRKEISSITFLNSTNTAPQEAWDVSMEGNRSVLAWTEESETVEESETAEESQTAQESEGEKLYDLYIAGNGGVAAPTVSRALFTGYSALKEIHFNGAFHTESVTNMRAMFHSCSTLTALDISGFNTSNVTDMSFMFGDAGVGGCSRLTALDVSGFDTSNVTDMRGIFSNCAGLTALDVSGFDTSNVTNMRAMFYRCTGLKTLDVSGFDTSNVTDMQSMFAGCKKMAVIYVSDRFASEQVTNGENCFKSCASLVGGNGTAYSEEHIDVSYARIDTPERPGYFTAKR